MREIAIDPFNEHERGIERDRNTQRAALGRRVRVVVVPMAVVMTMVVRMVVRMVMRVVMLVIMIVPSVVMSCHSVQE